MSGRLFLSFAMITVSSPVISASVRPSEPTSKFVFTKACTIESTYDSNVFLQSTTALADRSSWVTTIAPTLSVSTNHHPENRVTLTYNPGWTQFHSEGTEDFLIHRLLGSGQAKIGTAKLTASGNLSIIDGSDEGIIWAGQGGASATGAPSVRDRRDQAVLRANASVTWKAGPWSIRPLTTIYAADFRTVQKSTPGYLNYVDRNDLQVGIDLTRAISEKLSGGFAYRFGSQDQARLLEYPEEYDNRYHRLLAVCEGRLAPWLTLAFTGGPELRHYGDRTPVTMGKHDVTNLFLDATLTAAVTGSDSVAVVVRQYQMLSMAGRGAFEDLNLDLSWRHTLSKRTSATVALHAYNTDFLKPALRNDWVYSARVAATSELNETWKVDLAVTHDRGRSKVPDTSGREFDRTAISTAVRCTF